MYMGSSNVNTILIVIVLVLVVGGGVWWYQQYGPDGPGAPQEESSDLQINIGDNPSY